MHINILYTHIDQVDKLIFYFGALEPIFTIRELDNLTFAITYCHIILYLQIFQTFDKTALDISSGTRISHL